MNGTGKPVSLLHLQWGNGFSVVYYNAYTIKELMYYRPFTFAVRQNAMEIKPVTNVTVRTGRIEIGNKTCRYLAQKTWPQDGEQRRKGRKMDRNEKIKLLRRYLPAQRRIIEIHEEILRARSAAERISPAISAMQREENGGNALERAVERIAELEEQETKFAKPCEAVRRAIGKLPCETERLVLRYKYTNYGYSFSRIAGRIGTSRNTVMRMHDLAIENLEIE